MNRTKKITLMYSLMACVMFIVSLVFLARGVSAASPEKELKIGCTLPLTGFGAPYGIGIKTGFEIAFDEINAAGGIKTSKMIYKPKLFAEDDEFKGEIAVTKFNKLLYSDKIDPIVYNISGGGMMALQPIAKPRKIILIYGGQADFEPQNNPYSFRSLTHHFFHQQISFEWFKKNLPNVKRVGILNPDYASGHDQVRVFRQIAKMYGLTIACEEYFPTSTTDFTPILTKILPKKLDMLHIGASGPGIAGLIVKQARELGYTGPIYASCKQDVATLLEVAGDYSNDYYVNSLVYGASGVPQKFNGLYEECVRRKGKWFDVATMGHRTANEIKATIEIADGLEPEKVRDAYKKIQIDSVDGPVHYGSPFGTQVYYPVPILKIENKKPKMLGLYQPKVMTESEYLWKPEGPY